VGLYNSNSNTSSTSPKRESSKLCGGAIGDTDMMTDFGYRMISATGRFRLRITETYGFGRGYIPSLADGCQLRSFLFM
ncbi:3375_t:CDS:2, partial [Paraglomus occultum]